MNVLVVEDRVGLPLIKMLEKWGYNAELAEDGETAWEILSTAQIDFLISDWNVPKLSGLELVKRVRQLDKYQDLPILMISGRSQKADIVTAVQSGIDNYIIKPFTAAQLKEKISQLLQSREGDGFKKELEQFVAGHETFSRRQDTPFIIFGESVNRLVDLAEPGCRRQAQYLITAAKAIDQLNSASRDLEMGYTVLVDTNDIIKYIKASSVRKRIGLVAVAIDCKGNVPLLARLLGTNPECQFPVIVVCNRLSDVSSDQRAMLESYGVKVFERQELDTAMWKAMLAGFVEHCGKTDYTQSGGKSLFESA